MHDLQRIGAAKPRVQVLDPRDGDDQLNLPTLPASELEKMERTTMSQAQSSHWFAIENCGTELYSLRLKIDQPIRALLLVLGLG